MDGGLYAIIDPSYLGDKEDAAQAAEQVLCGGALVVQLRDKNSTTRTMLERARAMGAVCADYGALFVVNDRLDVALASGAGGVHLGPGDLPVDDARAIAGEQLVIGASAGTVEAATELAAKGADYLGVGAVYEARASKADASPPRGPEVIRAVVDAVDIPVFGIGGIDETNAADVVAHGASGVAVIRAVLGADDRRAAARRLVDAIESR